MFWYVDVFFFQAEDGIRDHCVTGVQTCALPISLILIYIGTFFLVIQGASQNSAQAAGQGSASAQDSAGSARSEERRVGKECRCRGAPSHEKKKKEDERRCVGSQGCLSSAEQYLG